MKNKTILFLLFLLAGILSVSAQTVEKQINGETYLLDTNKNTLRNKANRVERLMGKQTYCKDFTVEEITPIESTFDTLFTEKDIERLLDLGELDITFFCDLNGNVLETTFAFKEVKAATLSDTLLSDIRRIESALKKRRVKLSNRCGKNQYYRFLRSFRFDTMLKIY